MVHSGAGVTCLPPCNATNLTAAVVDAHAAERRRGALRSSAALRETGGVGRAGDLVSERERIEASRVQIVVFVVVVVVAAAAAAAVGCRAS